VPEAHLLQVRDVVRTFGDRAALDRVSFEVRPGRLTGFVGANGAGKTTAMRIIMGVLASDAGTVTLADRPLDLAARRRFGYMPEERGLYPKMRVLDQLVFLGRVHGLTPVLARTRAIELLEELELGDRMTDVLHTLSLGNQQRVQVAAALLHEPVLLILDEPFSGLDPIAVDAMAVRLRARAEAGVPVLFSSHQLELVERLCDDLVVIHEGRIVARGDAAQLQEEHAGTRIRIVVDGGTDWLSAAPGVTVVSSDPRGTVLELADGADGQSLLLEAQRHGAVREFGRVVPTLSEIFHEVAR
jgi:ABC-2 type transport system ATP-binding protein